MFSWWLLTWAKIRHFHDSSVISGTKSMQVESFYQWLQYTSMYFLCVCLAQDKRFVFLTSCFASAKRLWSINRTRLIKTTVFQIYSTNKTVNLRIPHTQEGSFDRQDRLEELLLKPIFQKLRVPYILILISRKSHPWNTTYYEGFADFMSAVT